jgi:hypothetical protein
MVVVVVCTFKKEQVVQRATQVIQFELPMILLLVLFLLLLLGRRAEDIDEDTIGVLGVQRRTGSPGQLILSKEVADTNRSLEYHLMRRLLFLHASPARRAEGASSSDVTVGVLDRRPPLSSALSA